MIIRLVWCGFCEMQKALLTLLFPPSCDKVQLFAETHVCSLPVRCLGCEQDTLAGLLSSKPQSKPFPLPGTGACCLTWDVLQTIQLLQFNNLPCITGHVTPQSCFPLSVWS